MLTFLGTCGVTAQFFMAHATYKVGRAKRGAIILKPEGQDIFDIPSARLKKVVQGFIWRDEHFAGMALKDIARREKCSEGYVGTAIFESFEFGKAA